MRVVGMFLLGFGICLLIPSGVALYYAEGILQVIGFLVCTGLIPIPMIVGGIAIIRKAEDAAAQEAGWTEEAEEQATGNPVGRTLERARQFELNDLNWVGWLLLLGTFGFVVAEAFILARLFENDAWGGRPVNRLIGLGMVFLSIGFFVGLRWLLRVLGISIYRR
jgi:hypothetical protein